MSWFEGRRFWIALLVISLAVNGVLAGILAQRMLTPPAAIQSAERPMMAGGGFNPWAFIEALPEERRDAARVELREGLRELRPLFREMIAHRREMNALLHAETFDEAELLAVMAQIRAVRARIDAGGEAVILAIVSELEPDARRAALEAAYGSSGRRMRRGGPRPEGGDDRRSPFHHRGDRGE
jgi:uncharacterized membrane protein